MPFRSSKRTATILGLTVALVFGVSVGGGFFVDAVNRFGNEQEKKESLSVAETAAAAIEPDNVKALNGFGWKKDAPEAERVRDGLRRLQHTLSPAQFVYLIVPTEGAVTILADTQDPRARTREAPDRGHPEVQPAYKRVFSNGISEFVGPYRDKSGIWVTSLAPIRDPTNGKVLAVIGFDFAGGEWWERMRPYSESADTLVVGIAVLAALFVIGLLLQNRYRQRIARLNLAMENDLAELALSNRIVENSPTILFRFDPKTLALSYLSHNIERYGYRSAELTAKTTGFRALFHPEDQPAMKVDTDQLLQGKVDRVRRELRFKKSDGSWVWFDSQLNGVRDANGRLIALEGVLFDITETKKAEERLSHLANHDALTGLANRTAFVARLREAFTLAKRNGRAFAVLYLDIDHFKDINDAFGQAKGDLFLQAVGERLMRISRETDTIARFSVARLGGDEFAILQTDVADPSDAAALAERLNVQLALPFAIGDNDVHATVSIGVALYDASIAEPNDMLSQADLALYRAKDGGRNQYHFHSADLDAKVRERVTIAEELHAALKNHELELYYQPQVETPSGRIIGMEALMRWNHPRRGLVLPEIFIPVAEKSGIIVAMGRWAIGEACRQMRRWRDEEIEPPIMGVNVSPVQIDNSPALDLEIREILRETGIEPGMLELELTESILIETTVTHNDILQRLRKIGVRIAIDDFGTGYSSLQYLHTYPINRIKIAQQFMHAMETNPSDAAIVRTTISLGRALNIELIAEGVETPAQLAVLNEAGCSAIQGFLFSEPVKAAPATQLLRRKRLEYAVDAPFLLPKPAQPHYAIG